MTHDLQKARPTGSGEAETLRIADLVATGDSAPPAVRRVAKPVRAKLWELQDCWFCTIIGTCIGTRDLRRLARKAGQPVDDLGDFELHRLAVEAAANRRHPLTQRVQRYLDDTHATHLRRFRRATDDTELDAVWREARERGELAGALWALVTHPHVGSALVHRVYGEVHMLSHRAGAQFLAQQRRLRERDEIVGTLTSALGAARRKRIAKVSSLVRRVRDLESSLRGLRIARAPDARASVEQPLADSASSTLPPCPCCSPATDINGTRSPAGHERVVAERIARLEQRLADVCEERRELRRDLRDAKDRITALASHNARLQQGGDQTAGAPEQALLCGRCVLYLGGRSQQCRHLQAMVEARQGQFLHHDGGREDSAQRIADLVARADAVLCPADCISHSAMKKARSLCDRQRKPIVFMPRASLAAFADGLDRIARA